MGMIRGAAPFCVVVYDVLIFSSNFKLAEIINQAFDFAANSNGCVASSFRLDFAAVGGPELCF